MTFSEHCPSGAFILRRVNEDTLDMPPLFIPLKGEYYDAFYAGTKLDELRLYGPRWNENTCIPGRRVTLSRGYGKEHRRSGVITQFAKQHGRTFGYTYRNDIQHVYGTLDRWIARISIKLDARTP